MAESKEQYLQRALSYPEMRKKWPDAAQRYAVANSLWEKDKQQHKHYAFTGPGGCNAYVPSLTKDMIIEYDPRFGTIERKEYAHTDEYIKEAIGLIRSNHPGMAVSHDYPDREGDEKYWQRMLEAGQENQAATARKYPYRPNNLEREVERATNNQNRQVEHTGEEVYDSTEDGPPRRVYAAEDPRYTDDEIKRVIESGRNWHRQVGRSNQNDRIAQEHEQFWQRVYEAPQEHRRNMVEGDEAERQARQQQYDDFGEDDPNYNRHYDRHEYAEELPSDRDARVSSHNAEDNRIKDEIERLREFDRVYGPASGSIQRHHQRRLETPPEERGENIYRPGSEPTNAQRLAQMTNDAIDNDLWEGREPDSEGSNEVYDSTEDGPPRRIYERHEYARQLKPEFVKNLESSGLGEGNYHKIVDDLQKHIKRFQAVGGHQIHGQFYNQVKHPEDLTSAHFNELFDKATFHIQQLTNTPTTTNQHNEIGDSAVNQALDESEW